MKLQIATEKGTVEYNGSGPPLQKGEELGERSRAGSRFCTSERNQYFQSISQIVERWNSCQTREGFFHEVEAIVSPEHFGIHEKGRRPECTTADGLVDVGAQLGFDTVALDERRIDFHINQQPSQRFLLTEVLSLFPYRAERRRMKLRKAANLLRRDRAAHDTNRVERKIRTEP